MYLFTNRFGTLVIDMQDFPMTDLAENSSGSQALVHRAELEKETGKKVIAWCLMGGDNPKPEI